VKRHAKKFYLDVTPTTRIYRTLCGRTVEPLRIGHHSREYPLGKRVTCKTCKRLRRQ
jgi:hypothetical protein